MILPENTKNSENLAENTAEFVGRVAYLIGKHGKKWTIDYLSRNTPLSVKSSKNIVESVAKYYGE